MKNKRNVLYSLITMLTAVICFAVQAQQKNETHRANFSMGGNMEAVVTSLSPAPSMCGFGVVIRIKGEEYHLNFVPDRSDQSLTRFLKYAKQLNTLKVNDKIVVRSYNALLYLPSDPLPIILGDYLERNNKIIFKRDIREDGWMRIIGFANIEPLIPSNHP